MADNNPSATLQGLIQKFLDNHCTREELDQLLKLIAHDSHLHELPQLLKLYWENPATEKKTVSVDWQSKFENMMQEATSLDPVPRPVSPVRKIFKRAWMAAASVVLLICTAAYFLERPGKTVVKTPETKNANLPLPDVSPGRNIAVLTLANGSTIILDTARNGTITRLGNTQVVKLNNGEVAYNASNTGDPEITYNKISTPLGGQYEIVLPDGSKVWLNAGSSIYFPTAFTGQKRAVVLTGEGYFEVAKNPAKPFVVTANKMEVQVLGTHFNVNAYNDELSVSATLLEGTVRVGRDGDAGSAARSLLSKPGQQANLDRLGKIKTRSEVDTDEIVSWKNGKFNFNDADVPAMMRQVARWYNVDVRYEGPVTKKTFTGKIDRNIKLSELVTLLAYAKVPVRVEGKTIVVTP